MEKVKRDTVWHIRKSYKPDIDSLVTDVIYHANGDTVLHVRDIPSGMIYTAERAHEIKVFVKHTAPIGGSPIGHMVFGEDTLQNGVFKTSLMVDGTWQPIEENSSPEISIQPSNAIFEKPMRFNAEIRQDEPVAQKPIDYGNYCDAVLLCLIIMAAPYFIYTRTIKALKGIKLA